MQCGYNVLKLMALHNKMKICRTPHVFANTANVNKTETLGGVPSCTQK